MRSFCLIFVFLAIFECVISFSTINRDVTEPDMKRNVYLRLEKLIWENSVDNPTKTQNERLKSVFSDHSNFVSTYLMNGFDIDDLKMLIHSNGWHNLQSEIINVHRLFISFRQHLSRESNNAEKNVFNEGATIDLTDHVLNDAHWPVQGSLENLHKIVAQEKLYFVEVTNLAASSCSLQRSAQQIMYQLYKALTIVELEAYVMMQCSYMLLTVYNKDDHSNSAHLLRADFMQQSEQSLEITQQIFERASRSVWRCDPETHIEDATYLQITRLLQGHMENEIDLNRDRTCMDTCSNYQFTEDYGCSDRSICNRQSKCLGKLLNCITPDDNMWVCPANKQSSRRYEYIVYDDGRVLGEAKPCGGNGYHLEQYWNYKVFWHCDHCFCICDEQGKKSDRFFSLRPAVSDTRNNMVVTGIRFVKEDRIIHLQIKESELVGYGNVDEATTRWVPISKFSILDKGIKDGIDYHMLQYDQREVDLDDLVAPNSHVVTGVKLRHLGHHMNLEIRVSEINFSTGRVEPEKSFWVSNDNTENSVGKNKRTQLNLKWPHVPTKAKKPSNIMSRSNTFIKFTHSDIGKDAAQTTVPFLDSQEVSSTPAMPLQGVGLYYKGENGFGGFIAPKIETLDYTSFIRANLQNFRSENAV